MFHDDGWFDAGAELNMGWGGGNQFCVVGDGGFIPRLVCGMASAKGFDIPDLNGFPGYIRAADCEHLLLPMKVERFRRIQIDKWVKQNEQL